MAGLTTRSRALLILLCLALCVCDRVDAHQVRSNTLAKRQGGILGGDDDSTTAAGTTAAGTTANTATNTNTGNTNTNTTPTTTAAATTTNPQQTENTGTNTQQQNTGTTTVGTTTTAQQTQTTGNTAPTNTQQQNTQTQETQEPTSSVMSTTDANGETVLTTVFVSGSDDTSSATSSASSAASTSDDDDSSSGIGTGSIIGMSVAGGVAVIGVIAFFIWKFTRKRYADFDDEPIKWPELNAHAGDNLNYALPASHAGDGAGTGAGAGVGLDSTSEINLARNKSAAFSAYSQPSQYTHQSAADSTADLYAPGGDPYAVPPLPHLNPNQPYRDDPAFGASAAYYDPYRGPLPHTFNDTASISSAAGYGGEAIPMNNLAAGGLAAGGRRSPGPQAAFDAGGMPPMTGRVSPGPSLAYGRSTPGPVIGASGRVSPGPGAAYGGNGY